MFTRVTQPAYSETQLFAALHPQLSSWFRRRFAHFSPAQLHAVPEVLAGRSVLLTSPTGSGKTLAAFLSVFDWLARAHDRAELPNGIVAVYVSPLRALAYDLRKNLEEPVRELGWDWLRVTARTGDTTPAERAKQRRKPPHIFVTTPESLTLMLSQPGWIEAFASTRFLIADELHALAENKRGSLLAVAAERLEQVAVAPDASGAEDTPPVPDRRHVAPVSDWRLEVGGTAAIAAPGPVSPSPATPGVPPVDDAPRGHDGQATGDRTQAGRPCHLVRIGLSATVAPLETVAAFLVGPGRPCRIAEVTQSTPAKIEVFSPLREHAYPPAGYTATRVLAELSVLLEQHETTLVFTNTRSGAESIGLRLKQLRPELSDLIEVHHASLDRGVRLEIEDRLKRGELRAVVCSTSLEMGIDIGSIDVVVMVSAPKGVSRALQRIGRSGHSMGRTSHGILVASNINDLAECAVTARMMARRELEPVKIHDNPLDVLAQTIVGLAAQTEYPCAHAQGRDPSVARSVRSGSEVAEARIAASALSADPCAHAQGHGPCVARSVRSGMGENEARETTRPRVPAYTPDEAFALVRRAYPFRALDRPTFDRVLRYLRGGGASLERNYEDVFGKVRLDPEGRLVLASPRVARSFYQNIGTINTESMVQVRLGRRNLGQVEESFMRGIRPGDVFVLNGRCVRLVKTHLLSAQVVRADHALPTVPRWYANKMPLASGLAAEVVRLRTEVAKRLGDSCRAGSPDPAVQPDHSSSSRRGQETPPNNRDAALAFLRAEYGLSAANARALIEHFALQAQVSAIPTAGMFLIERYREGDLLHYFFHALIGRSANDALSRIVAQRVQALKGGNALVTIDDYGFLLSLHPFQAMDEPELRTLLVRAGAEDALRLALADASLVKWQFRGVAQTGLMVPRRVHGVERGARMLQWSAEIIFEVLREHEPDHPLLLEAYAEATLRFLDLPRALAFLDDVARLRWDVRDLPRVSPFSFGIYVSKIKETMTLEDPETTIERLYHAMYGER